MKGMYECATCSFDTLSKYAFKKHVRKHNPDAWIKGA